VAVERRRRQADAFADRADRDPVYALLEEQAARRRQDLRPALVALAARFAPRQ
jgi:hypothetical protein